MRLRRRRHIFPGCVRLHSGGTLIDFRVCPSCPFHGDGCTHIAPAYEYGELSIIFKPKKFTAQVTKQEGVFYG
ncbi:MAG: hypothetical protein Q8Q12_00505 [bacterium]|nr:hypothetical protein [bacterium]